MKSPRPTQSMIAVFALLIGCAGSAIANDHSSTHGNGYFGGLKINMAYESAYDLIQRSLQGVVKSKSCKTYKISPTDDAIAIGDILISCEGVPKIGTDAISSFSAIFADRKLKFLGAGEFLMKQVSSQQVTSMMSKLAVEGANTHKYPGATRYRAFGIQSTSTFSQDKLGNTLETLREVELNAAGVFVEKRLIRLTPPDFEAYQRERIRKVEEPLQRIELAKAH